MRSARVILTGTALAAVLVAVSSQPAVVAQVSSAPQPDERADLNRGVWTRGPNLPSPRQDAAVAVLAGRIYLIGGFGPHDEQMDSTLVWDPDVGWDKPAGGVDGAAQMQGAWVEAAPIPEPVDHAAAAALGGSIYVAGGRIENLVSNKFWRYDVAADRWVELPSMPVPRYGATMQALGDKLYLIGGAVSHGNDATSMEIYDTRTGRWSLEAFALPAERQGLASAVLDGYLIVVGGRDDQQRNLTACQVYDPASDRWAVCSYLHEPRADFGLSVVNGRLVAVGGDDLLSSQATQTMEISEPGMRGWLDGPWMPSPRHGMAQVTLGNVVWIIGGATATGTAPSTAVMRFVSPIVKVKFKGRAS
jgi:N-acetylneuraminic acid mutarotase